MINFEAISAQTAKLLSTPLLKNNQLKDLISLRIFMEHHVFAVWDFMCLTKSLQSVLAPACSPWLPPKYPSMARFINEIVLAEETDLAVLDGGYLSHFELYLSAMEEVGADTQHINQFIKDIENKGINAALKFFSGPEASRDFVRSTLSCIDISKPWCIAAAFTFGRETVIPKMFKNLLDNKIVSDEKCPAFKYYLDRHIEVDGGSDGHGAMAVTLLNHLCQNNPQNENEVTETAISCLRDREKFWKLVDRKIQMNKKDNHQVNNEPGIQRG